MATDFFIYPLSSSFRIDAYTVEVDDIFTPLHISLYDGVKPPVLYHCSSIYPKYFFIFFC